MARRRRTGRRSTTRPQAPSYSWLIVVVAALAAAALVRFGWPPVTVLQAGLLLAAWLEPPVILSGVKDRQTGMLTPAGPAETRRLNRYRFWSGVRVRLLLPSGDMLPGWPVLAAWIGGLVAGAVSALLPVADPLLRAVDAWSAFTLVVVFAAAARRAAHPDFGPPHPGVRVDSLPRVGRWALLGAVIAGVLTAVVAWWLLPDPPAPVVVDFEVIEPDPDGFGLLPDLPGARWWAAMLLGVGAALLAVWGPWRSVALSRWRLVCARAAEWDVIWRGLKFDPTPVLLDVSDVGPARVETFTAPTALGASAFLPLAGKVAPAAGAGMQVRVLEMWDTDRQGQPVPGRPHPLQFRVVTWAADATPDLTDATLPVPMVELFAHCQMVKVAEANNMLRPMLMSATLISQPPPDGHTGPYPGIWRAVFAAPAGPSMHTVRSHVGAAAFSAAFGAPTLIEFDQVPEPGGDAIIFGAVGDPDVQLPLPDTRDSPDFAAWMDLIEMTDHWDGVWGETLKQGNSPPVPQAGTRVTGDLPNGTEVRRLGFVVRRGIDLATFNGQVERNLATAMDAATLASITGWFGDRDRSGRHPQAFALSYAHGPVPDRPETLRASPASEWVMAGLLNQAFDAAKLPRPDLLRGKVLTAGKSAKAVWELHIRTYDGCTAADVTRRADALRSALRTEWFRVQADESTGDTCRLFAGGAPAGPSVALANPGRDELRLLALDWAQVWIDCRVLGAAGHPPTLLDADVMPGNPEIKVLDFRLPSPVSLATVKGNTAKLRTASANEFVDVRPGEDGADSVRLLVCRTDPMPTLAPFDFDFRDPAGALPLGSGIDGSTVTVDLRDIPHLAVFGSSGSGKSSTAQGLVFAALDLGCRMAVVDVQKKGADFRFAVDRLYGFATELPEAAALMDALYAEVKRRALVNAEHGAGSTRDRPAGVRPPTVVVLLDEFVGLITADKPAARPEDDPEMERQRLADVAAYTARRRIGFLTGRIASEARSADVHLILATQRLKQDMLDSGLGDLKTNLARILLGKANTGERMTALRDPENAPALGEVIPKGRGIWESTMQPAQPVQFWYATPEQYRSHLESRVPQLADGDRLDITGFLRDEAAGDVPGSVVPRPEPPLEVDRGTFEFSLDDLDSQADDPADGEEDLDDPGAPTGDVDWPVADTVPDPEQDHPTGEPGAAEEDPGVLMLLTVDGLLAPAGPVPDGHDTATATIGGEPVLVDVTVTRAVAALPCRKAWLTDWGRDAADAVRAVVPGLPDWPVLDTVAEGGWWKLHAIAEFLASAPGVTALVWPDEEMLPGGHSDEANALLTGRGGAGLIMPVNPFTGLTVQEVDMVRDWIHRERGEAGDDGTPELPKNPQPQTAATADSMEGRPGAFALPDLPDLPDPSDEPGPGAPEVPVPAVTLPTAVEVPIPPRGVEDEFGDRPAPKAEAGPANPGMIDDEFGDRVAALVPTMGGPAPVHDEFD